MSGMLTGKKSSLTERQECGCVNITSNRLRTRTHCFDLDMPLQVLMYTYKCHTHAHRFSINQTQPASTVVSMMDYKPLGVCIFPRTIVTHRLWDDIITSYIETKNMSSVTRLVTARWQLQHSLHQQQVSTSV